jgi:hypothetical protein
MEKCVQRHHLRLRHDVVPIKQGHISLPLSQPFAVLQHTVQNMQEGLRATGRNVLGPSQGMAQRAGPQLCLHLCQRLQAQDSDVGHGFHLRFLLYLF